MLTTRAGILNGPGILLAPATQKPMTLSDGSWAETILKLPKYAEFLSNTTTPGICMSLPCNYHAIGTICPFYPKTLILAGICCKAEQPCLVSLRVQGPAENRRHVHTPVSCLLNVICRLVRERVFILNDEGFYVVCRAS